MEENADLEDDIKQKCAEFQKRRDLLMESLAGEDKLKPLKPAGAFYLFCDISRCGLDSLTFSQKLLDEKGVAVIPGGPFGDDRFIRISFATDQSVIKEGVRRIREFVKDL